jgi:exodeoxyribonuclease-5
VFNGQMFEVVSRLDKTHLTMNLAVKDDNGGEREVEVWKDGFRGLPGEQRIREKRWATDYAAMTFGWAITCHKAQGSQWDRVLIVDDWRGQGRTQWLYTAVTRASKEVAILKP